MCCVRFKSLVQFDFLQIANTLRTIRMCELSTDIKLRTDKASLLVSVYVRCVCVQIKLMRVCFVSLEVSRMTISDDLCIYFVRLASEVSQFNSIGGFLPLNHTSSSFSRKKNTENSCLLARLELLVLSEYTKRVKTTAVHTIAVEFSVVGDVPLAGRQASKKMEWDRT